MNRVELENYITEIEAKGTFFFDTASTSNSTVNNPTSKSKLLVLTFLGCIDFFILHLKLLVQSKTIAKKKIVFISPNLCTKTNGNYEVTLLQPLDLSNIVYINHSKQKYIYAINNSKVYNIGLVVNLLNNTIYKSKKKALKNFYSHTLINNSILRKLNETKVFTLCHYDVNGLSLAFSEFRKKFIFIEVQHGGMINFYPYSNPVDFKIVDLFYVRNEKTIDFLKNHLAKNYKATYKIIPYPKTNLIPTAGTQIMYASTIEINGFHKVFIAFLKNNKLEDLNIIIRLHPRELSKKDDFENEIKKYTVNYRFDESKNWLQNNTIKNLIVISPWSSIIEEAVDNGFKAVVIDQVGKERFKLLIDNEHCFFSENIEELLLSSSAWFINDSK